MSLFARLFRPQVELPERLALRVRAWRERPAADEHASLEVARFVVVDVETSGLDPRRDRLLAIGAVPVEARRLRPREGYEAFVRVDAPSTRENILIHGISPDVQTGGTEPDEALMGFLELAGRDVLVAFHADFDRAVLGRAAREHLGVRLPNDFLDLARLAPVLVPEARLPQAALDDWLAFFGLRAAQRHHATHDALATGELLLILLARAAARGFETLAQLHGLEEQQRRTVSLRGFGGV